MIAAQTVEAIERGAFGQEMHDRRKYLGYTQQQSADLAGISLGRWRQLELGYENRLTDQDTGHVYIKPSNPSRVMVRKVAYALGWPLHDAYESAGYKPDDEPPTAAEIKKRDREQIARELFPTLTPVEQDGVLEVMHLLKKNQRIPLKEAS